MILKHNFLIMRKLIYTTAVFLAAFSLNAQNFQPYDLNEQEQAYQQALNDFYNNQNNTDQTTGSQSPMKVIPSNNDQTTPCGDNYNNAFLGWDDVGTGGVLFPENATEALYFFNNYGGASAYGYNRDLTLQEVQNLFRSLTPWLVKDGLDDCYWQPDIDGNWPNYIDITQIPPGAAIDNDDWRNGFGAPIGSGLLISSLLAVAYGIFSARRKRKEISN